MKIVDGGPMMLMPAAPGTCERCGTAHPKEQPHNQQSLFWQYWFLGTYNRWPTWADALEHCSPEVKAFWVKELAKRGIKVKLPEPLVQEVKVERKEP